VNLEFFVRGGADSGPDVNALLTQIRPNTPAERAGLRVGDLLISADGRSLAGLGHTGRSYVVAGPAGKPITLVVQRAGASPRPVALVRDVFAPSSK
jgi:carboxyl-terminal processing protease